MPEFGLITHFNNRCAIAVVKDCVASVLLVHILSFKRIDFTTFIVHSYRAMQVILTCTWHTTPQIRFFPIGCNDFNILALMLAETAKYL